MADNAEKVEDLGFVPDEEISQADVGFVPDPDPVQEPDMAPMKAYFEENLKKRPADQPSTSFFDDVKAGWAAGWDQSVLGLATGGKPDDFLPENASMAANIASGIASIAGDLPAIIPGFFAGGAGGAAIGAPAGPAGVAAGTLVGAGAGSNALPAAVRSILMQHYEKGDIKDFRDFWERSSSVFIETMKQGVVGAGASLVGGAVGGKLLNSAAAPAASRLAAGTVAEVGTMVSLGAAIEGEVPSLEDFASAGALVATIHGLGKVSSGGSKAISSKMRKIYAETGIKPEQVLEEAKNNPILHQELLMDNEDIPSSYKTDDPLGKIKPSESGAEGPLPKEKPVEVTMNDVMNEPGPEIKPDNLAVRTILETVGEKADKAKEGYNFGKAYTDFVDRLNPIKEAVKEMGVDPEKLSVKNNPYALSRMANDYKAKAKHALERGTLKFGTLEVNGKGFSQIIEPFKNNLQEFEAYLISKRAFDYQKRGLNAGVDMEAAREVVRMGEAKYAKAATELVEFQRRNLEYLRDSGVISEKSFDAMVKAGDNYIPMKRIMEPEEFQNKRKGGALKRVKGVEDGADIKTQSPLLSIMENTEVMMKFAERNRAVESFVQMAELTKTEGLIEKVEAKSRPIEVSDAEVKKFLEQQGIDAPAEAFNIFRPNQIQLAANEFEVIRDGKRVVYRTSDELAQAFKALDGDPVATGIVVKLFRGITTLKKIGITLTPEFVTRNFMRDQMMTAATSKGNVVPFVDVVVAMGDLFKKNDTYYNWLKSGGAQGAFMELNESYLQKDVFKLEKQTGMLESAWNVIKSPVDAAIAGAQLIELAPRLAEFKKVSGKASEGSKVFEGGMASREVTLDFQRIGAKMSAWNAITAFTNATIQGADKAARALKNDPVGVTTKAAMYITTPSVLLWWANKDDERYKAIPRWEKDLYWHIITDKWVEATPEDHADQFPEHLTRVEGGKMYVNKGTTYRVPKPHEFGVLFGSLPERVLEKMYSENPRAFDGFAETVLHMATPSAVPDAAAPVLEQWANKSLFTGRRMIPQNLEKVAPEFQYTDYTSETAKQLSKLTSYLAGPDRAVSPIVLDNYVRQWAGSWGQYAVQLADKGLEKAGVVEKGSAAEASLADIPAIKAFVTRYPGSNAQQITDFYDRKNEVEQRLATLRMLKKKPEMEDEYESYLQRIEGEPMVALRSTEKAISNSRKLIQSINSNPEISPKEKRQLIDAQYHAMIEAAKMAMEQADILDQELKDAQERLALKDK